MRFVLPDIFLKTLITEGIKQQFQISLEFNDIVISDPPTSDLGHKATAVAFFLSKKLSRSPQEIAVELIPLFQSSPDIADVQVVNGYLNVFFKPHFLLGVQKQIQEDDSAYAFSSKGEKVHLEYVSANPTGPLHIGHGRWAVLGSSLANILKRLGYSVFQEFYMNDAGNQIAKLQESVQAVRENRAVPEDGYHGEYVKELAQSSEDPVEFFKKQHAVLLARVGSHMDNFFSEKSLIASHKAEEAIEILKSKGLTYIQDGALFFKTTLWGDDKDRAIIKKDGSFTYFAPDIAYHFTKIQSGAQWIIDILGADHHGYVRRLEAAVGALSDTKLPFSVLLGQFVNLMKNGVPVRMSKRAGEIVSLEEVLDEIGVDALRIILLSKKFSHPIDFDVELLKSKNKDNPLFYIQYAHARICSILVSLDDLIPPHNCEGHPLHLSDIEVRLLMQSLQYREAIETAAREMDPYYIYTYLYDLATLFHKFYEKNRVREGDRVIFYRVTILRGIARIMKDAASLLGISMPSKI